MSQQDTREVCVLTEFRDRDGKTRAQGSVFHAAYKTERQRQVVNEMVHRGFLTFEVVTAKKHLAKSAEHDPQAGEKAGDKAETKAEKTKGD